MTVTAPVAPRFTKVAAGEYVASIVNYKGYGVRATVCRASAFGAFAGEWHLFVTNFAEGSARDLDESVVLANSFHPTKSAAVGMFNVKFRNADIRPTFTTEVRYTTRESA